MSWQQIEELFGEALELAPEERALFLTEACGNDEALRREVEGLLASHKRAGDFIQAPALEDALNLIESSEPSLEKGHRIGVYEVIGEIGRGGMGTVYLAARADDEYRTRVAIKLIKRGMDTDDILRLFRNERQILASLNHPNIARLYDGGTTPDGLPYFVMEYIDGLPLARYCEEHELATDKRLQLFRTICSAVSHAHQNLVVHRDLKPSNILITHEGEPKLLDFGVARFLNPELIGESPTQTRTRFRVLTPQYASPEQVRGEHVTTASDIYSLGVVLYELLTRRLPYKLRDGTADEMARGIYHSEPPKPSDAFRDTGNGGPEDSAKESSASVTSPHRPVSASQLRGDLDNIVLMALRKEPARRYKSVEQFSEEILRQLKRLPVIARKDTVSYRASKFIGRNTVGVVATSLVVLAVVAGFIATAWQARVAARERDQARIESAKAHRIKTFLQDTLASASPLGKGPEVKVVDALDDAAKRVESELASQPEVLVEVQATIGYTYYRLSNGKAAEAILRAAIETGEKVLGDRHPATSLSRTYLALLLMGNGDLATAEPLARQSLAAQRSVTPEGNRDLVMTLFTLGETLLRKGDPKGAEAALEEASELCKAFIGEETPNMVEIITSLGRVKEIAGDPGGAQTFYHRAIDVAHNLSGSQSIIVGPLGNLGRLLLAKGEYREAEMVFQQALELSQQYWGEQSYPAGYVLSQLGLIQFLKGDYHKAVEADRKALQILRIVVVSEDVEDVVGTLFTLSLSLCRTGNAAEGERYAREGLAARSRSLPAGHWLISSGKSVIGECLTAQNKYAEAEPLLLEGYDGIKSALGDEHARTIDARRRLVTLYDRWKKPVNAARYRSAHS